MIQNNERIKFFNEGLTEELCKEFFSDESIDVKYKQNYIHAIAYHLRNVAKEKHGIDVNQMKHNEASDYVSKTLTSTMNYCLEHKLITEEELEY